MANINKIRLSGTTYDIQDINVSAHTANTDIHVTVADKAVWNAKADSSAVTEEISAAVSGKVDADFDNSLGFDINDDLGVYAKGNVETLVFNTASSKVKEYTFPSVYTNGSNNLYKVQNVTINLNQSFSGTVSPTKAIGVKYYANNDDGLKECWWDYSNGAFTINSDYSANKNVRLVYNSSEYKINLYREGTNLKTIVTIMVGGDYYIASSSNPTEADCYISYIKISTPVKKLQSVLDEKQRQLTPGDGIELDYSGNISANIKVTGDTREKVFNKATSATSINSLEETSISFNVNTGYTGDTTSTWYNLNITNISVTNEYIQAYIKYDAQNDSFSIQTGGDYITMSYSAHVLTVTAHKIIAIDSSNGFAALNDFDNVGCLFGKVYTNSNEYKLQEALDNKQDQLVAGENITISGNVISATGGGGGGVTIDPTLDSGSTNPVANSAITEAVLVPSYRGLIEVQYDIAFPNATALYVENVTSGAYQDATMIEFYLSGVSEVSENILVTSFSGHTLSSEPSYMDYEWTEDNSLIFTPKTSGNYFYKIHNGWDTGFGVYVIDDYSSGSSSSVIQNEIYPRITNLAERIDSFTDTKVTGTSYNNIYIDYGGYWYHEIEIFDNASGRFTASDQLRYNDFGYDNGVITVKKTSGATSGSTDCITSGGVYEQFGGMKIVKLTESEYTALVTKDPNVLYVVIPDPTNP